MGSAMAQIQTNAGMQYLQCMQKDMSTDFYDLSNTYFLADSLVSFDTQKGEGLVQWKRYRMSPRQAFNLNGYWPVRMQMLDFPDAAYENDPNLKIKIEFITPRTARIRMLTTPVEPKCSDQEDVMFCDGFKAKLSPPKLGGARGGLKKHSFRPLLSSPDSGEELATASGCPDGSTVISFRPLSIALTTIILPAI